MKKAASFISFFIAGLCCVVAAFFCEYYYTLYRHTVTDFEYKVCSFEMRLANLEAHKPRELTPVRVWGMISTTDRAAETNWPFEPSGTESVTNYSISNSKDGAHLTPEIRLPAKSAAVYVFDIELENQFGPVVDVWLSHAAPYHNLAAFDEFRIYPNGTNKLKLVAQAKTDASIKMRFDFVVLYQK